MKKVLLSLAALASVAIAVPAAAQGYGRQGYDQRGQDSRNWTPIEARLERLQDRIQRGVQSGRLTRNEAQRIRVEFRDLVQRERGYSRGGLSYGEQADLNARFERLQARVRFERQDGETRRRGY